MTDKEIQKLLDALDTTIRAEGHWTKKRDDIIAFSSEAEKINLEEFISWFTEVEQ